MTGTDQGSLKTELSSGFQPLQVRLDPEDLRTLLQQVPDPTDAERGAGAFIGGAMFGTLQEGHIHVRALRPFFSSSLTQNFVSRTVRLGDNFQATIARSGDELALKQLQLIGWYCVRPAGNVGLFGDDIEFHHAHFPRRTDIALILGRAQKDGYRAELYARSYAGAFSVEDHRYSSFYLPADPSLITKPLQILILPANGDDIYLRSYEIMRTLDRRDRREEWKSLARAILNPNWLRVLSRQAGVALPHSIPAADEPSTEQISIDSGPAPSLSDLAVGSDSPTRPKDCSTDAVTANICRNEQVESARVSKRGDASISSTEIELTPVEARASGQQPSIALLFDEPKDERKVVSEENAAAGAAFSTTENLDLLNPEAQPTLGEKFRWLGVIPAWIVVVVFSGVAGLILIHYRALNLFKYKESANAQATTLGFEPVRTGSDWELHWDARTPALKAAKNGLLTIIDGVRIKNLELDRSELGNGRVLYRPETQDVSFRLQVYTWNGQALSESVRILASMSADHSNLPPTKAEKRLLSPPLSSPDRNSLSRLDIPRTAKPGDNANARFPLVAHASAPINPTSPNQDHPSSRARSSGEAKPAARSITSEPPVRPAPLALKRAQDKHKQVAGRAILPSNQDSMMQSEAKIAPPAKPSQAQMAHAQPSSLATSSSPAPKRIARSPAANLPDQAASYVAPQPLLKPAPNLTLLGAITYSVQEVAVEVYIDASGRVTNARLANADLNPSSILESAAVSAAREWTFEPARSHGKTIPSNFKILFRFTPRSQ